MGILEGPRPVSGPPATRFGMRHLSLISLTVQNSALILLLYHSRTMPPVNGHRYLASTAVFLAEVVKLALCASVALYELARSPSPAAATAASLLAGLAARVFRGDSWRLALPAALYTVQHSLQFVAVAHLDAATVQVTSQFKIIPTAVFSILILRRRLNAEQWVALALLLLGVAIVQIPGAAPADGAPPAPAGGLAGLRGLHKRSATYEGIEEDYLREHPTRSSAVGLAAALGAGSASALGSVLLEKVLKESASATGGGGDGRREPVGIWVRNVQLAVYALVPALGVGVGCVDGAAVARHGFLAGYNAVVWTVVACQALGGILVALCVHYADNIAKSFATSISILLSLFASILFFDFALTPYFLLGTTLVILATYLYNKADDPGGERPAIHIGVAPDDDEPPSSYADEKAPLRLPEFGNSGGAGGGDAPAGLHIKMPGTPRLEEGLSTSRPGTPLAGRHHTRKGSARGGYFEAKKE